MSRAFTISDRASLSAARTMVDLDTVTVVTATLKHRNLLPHAFKYALWAVRPGGTIVIEDDGGRSAAPPAYEVSFNIVRQWAFKFIGAGCEVESLDARRLVLRRTAPVLAPGWAAGVVFSGNDGEIPTLLRCLDGLALQPELDRTAGGEIVVSGPARDLGFLSDYPHVRYLPYETPPGPRFLIGQKKNALMAALTAPRMVILHARVILDAGALGRAPREFDISGPVTRIAGAGGERPYLSLSQTDAVWPGTVPHRPTRGLHDAPSDDPLALVERGGVFVDGGAFYVTRPVFEACPLHPLIAWEEAEDVEWCGRAFVQGFLIDIAPDSGALSQTSKLRDWSKLGVLQGPARAAWVFAKTQKAAVRHLVQRLLGRR
jgi:hypothetical protein